MRYLPLLNPIIYTEVSLICLIIMQDEAELDLLVITIVKEPLLIAFYVSRHLKRVNTEEHSAFSVRFLYTTQ